MTRRRWIPILWPFVVVGGLLLARRLFRPVPWHEVPHEWQHPDVYEDPQAAYMEPPEMIVPLPLGRDKRSSASARRGRSRVY